MFKHSIQDVHGKHDNRWLEAFGKLSNDEWIDILNRSVHERVIDGLEFPKFPADDLQVGTVGSANENTIKEARVFYNFICYHLKKEGHEDISNFKVMDFGACWGRYLRFFLKDVRNDNLYGIDVVEHFLEEAKKSGLPCNLNLVPHMGPSPFPSEYFDLAYGYSVFSHLSERCATSWLKELHRILKPGALFVGTTEARRFIDFCKDLHDHPEKQNMVWHENLAKEGANVEEYYKMYDSGMFTYMSTSGGPQLQAEFYGEAVLPREYFERLWGDHFELLDFDDEQFWQAAFVLKKK